MTDEPDTRTQEMREIDTAGLIFQMLKEGIRHGLPPMVGREVVAHVWWELTAHLLTSEITTPEQMRADVEEIIRDSIGEDEDED